MHAVTPRPARASTAPGAPRRRAGLSLIELMIALVLVGIVGTATANVLVKQQRFYRGAADLIETRSQIRQAIAVLPRDLRGISTTAGDIIAMDATSIDFFATIGTGIVCAAGVPTATTQVIHLAPAGGSRGLTGWETEPKLGDRISIFVNDSGTFTRRLDLAPVAAGSATVITPNAAACPVGTPNFVTAADNGVARPGFTVVRIPPDGTIASGAAIVGSPVRFLRRVRYGLYQRTQDNQWYLGYQEYVGGVATAVQPVSGPYRPAATDTTSGLRFRYYNDAGVELANTATGQVARIGVVVRGLTRGSSKLAGMRAESDGRHADFDRFSVAIRNRW